MSQTIDGVNNDENNPNSISYGPLSVSNSKAYSKVSPWLLMSLCTLYISYLIFRFCFWRLRRRKFQLIRKERQKVEQFWRKHTARLKAWTVTSSTVQLPEQAACDDDGDEKSICHWYPSSSGSSATLVDIVSCSDYYVNEQGDMPNFVESVQEPDALMEHNHEEPLPYYLKMYERTQQAQHHACVNDVLPTAYTHATRRRNSRKERFIATIISRINGHYQRKKRRQLHWQWSVAMGYCRYDYAYHLNTIIQRLLDERQQKTSIYHSNPTISVSSAAEEQKKLEHEDADHQSQE